MRARSIRLSIFILMVLGLALATLAFNNINIDLPGFPPLERGGSGPLGLKLGLDLRGGGHLVYQADTGTRIDATFSGAVTAADINGVLEAQGIADSEVEPSGQNRFRISTPLLDAAALEELEAGLEGLGTEEQPVGLEDFQFTHIGEPTSDQMEGAMNIISRRVNLFGTEEPIIQRFGDDRIIVQLPGASGSVTEVQFSQPVAQGELEEALAGLELEDPAINQLDQRTFRISSETLNQQDREALRTALEEGLDREDRPVSVISFQVTSGIDEAKDLIGQTARLEFKERTCADVACVNYTDAELNLTGDDLADAFASTDPQTGRWVVNIEFNSRGAQIFSDLTRRIVGQPTKRIAVFLDDRELIAPVAQAWIRDGRSQITGDFNREEARNLAIQLDSGRLPVPLKLIQESDVDALLGSESLRKSVLAGLVGLGLVMAFMVAYYRMAGVVASLALVFYAVLVLAVFKLIPLTLTLAHIGGFILSIGMAVDANILIFERMKEEMRVGRTLASSMEVGFSRAWPAIRDSNVSTLITCLVLLWFGNRLGGGLVTGFAISLGIGVLASMFTAVVLSRNLLQLLAWIGLGRRINLFTPERVQRAQTLGGGR